MRLVFREGGTVQKGEIAKRLGRDYGLELSEAEAWDKKCLDDLASLVLPKAWLSLDDSQDVGGESVSEVAADDTEATDLPDGSRYLTRPARCGGVVIGNLVGAVRLACDVVVEVLPKIGVNADDQQDRVGLRRMWEYATDLNLRENEAAVRVEDADLPLHEWLISRFLNDVDTLLGRGIRSQYVEQEENLSTVRGRLLVSQNLRTNVLAPHRFFCRIEEFSPDRPENRLIRSAIRRVMARSIDPDNQRRATQLNERLQEIPPSQNVRQDFARWRDDRLMVSYREIRSTCRWILESRGAAPIAGEAEMFGRFVRMNDVFERYVARWMQDRLRGTDFELLEQNSGVNDGRRRKVLCTWVGKSDRTMKPDILIYSRSERDDCVAILDAKWKRTVDKDDVTGRLSAGSDLYQMYAYAQHWLAGAPQDKLIALVYPRDTANAATEKFHFSRPNNIDGYSLRFQLPSFIKGQWVEGLIADHGSTFLSQFNVPS